jgi:hypothetical protein
MPSRRSDMPSRRSDMPSRRSDKPCRRYNKPCRRYNKPWTFYNKPWTFYNKPHLIYNKPCRCCVKRYLSLVFCLVFVIQQESCRLILSWMTKTRRQDSCWMTKTRLRKRTPQYKSVFLLIFGCNSLIVCFLCYWRLRLMCCHYVTNVLMLFGLSVHWNGRLQICRPYGTMDLLGI